MYVCLFDVNIYFIVNCKPIVSPGSKIMKKVNFAQVKFLENSLK